MTPWNGERIVEVTTCNRLYRVILHRMGKPTVRRVIFGIVEPTAIRSNSVEWRNAVRAVRDLSAA